MRHSILAAALVAITFAPPLIGGARAQTHSPDVMSRCNQAVGQMKFEGWPGDRNREMMMSSCLNNNGAIPGSQPQNEQRPVSLKHKKSERHHAAPRG